ncbi:hypothetical protein FB451DRAFT_1236872 [Mycena latifolia]|nr:hypothetical protein FB451DRAFT_1236872 [Mycena latifolia]
MTLVPHTTRIRTFLRQDTRSKKRPSLDENVPSAKRIKYTQSERKSFHFSKAQTILRDLTSGPASSPPFSKMSLPPATPQLSSNATVNSPRLLDTFDVSTLFRPTIDTHISTHPSFAAPAPLVAFSYLSSMAQQQAHEFMAGVSAFTQREVAAFNRASGGKSISSIPTAFYEGFMSAFSTEVNNLAAPRTSPILKASPPSAPERRLPLPYRRSRAPSPPSPRAIPLRTSNISNTTVSVSTEYKRFAKSATTFTTLRIPYSLRTWYPKLSMQSVPARKRRQTFPSSTPLHALASAVPTATPPVFGRNRNLYRPQHGF